jgi:septum formation protein
MVWGECIIHAMRLILASLSPRRADLMRAAGYQFEVVPADVDERPGLHEAAADYVARLAAEKAGVGAHRHAGCCVIGADTTVVVDGAIIGKPVDAADARRMLRRLSGRTHDVLTGVAVRIDARVAQAVVSTSVRVVALEAADVEWYVSSGEPEGKAGGYAIQGRAARFIDRIDGSYSNVVGLPLATLAQLLREAGYVESE